MQRILAMSPDELVNLRKGLNPQELEYAAEGLTPIQREALTALQGSPRMDSLREPLETRMLRDIYSERQLEAVMTDFWLNHFNVYLRKNQDEPYLLPAYEREVIRPNVLGKFGRILLGGYSEESGDVDVSRQLAEHRAEFQSGWKWAEACATGAEPTGEALGSLRIAD